MPDREKVVKGLQAHADGCGYRSHHCDAMECPYRYGDESCDIEEMCRDALAMLKEQEVVRCKDCKKKGDSYLCRLDRDIEEYGGHRTDAYDDWFCADGERKEGR